MDEKGNVSKTDTMSIFEKWMFFGHFYLISGSIFHPIFLKNQIKNEIKNGSKMRTVNTPIKSLNAICVVLGLPNKPKIVSWPPGVDVPAEQDFFTIEY